MWQVLPWSQHHHYLTPSLCWVFLIINYTVLTKLTETAANSVLFTHVVSTGKLTDKQITLTAGRKEWFPALGFSGYLHDKSYSGLDLEEGTILFCLYWFVASWRECQILHCTRNTKNEIHFSCINLNGDISALAPWPPSGNRNERFHCHKRNITVTCTDIMEPP